LRHSSEEHPNYIHEGGRIIKKYIKVYYRIECPAYCPYSGYLSSEKKDAFQKESSQLFLDDGWTLVPHTIFGAADTVTRGKEELYLHPQEFSGVVLEENIEAIHSLLMTAQTFSCYRVDFYKIYVDMPLEEHLKDLASQRDQIASDLLEAFRTSRRNLYTDGRKELSSVSEKYSLNLIDCKNSPFPPGNEVVREIFTGLVHQGKIIVRTTRYGVVYRTTTEKEMLAG